MKLTKLAIFFLLIVVGTGLLAAQSGRARDDSPRTRVIRQFMESAPKIGQTLPDIRLFDAGGKRFQLGSLKGHHTVLVLGCLT